MPLQLNWSNQPSSKAGPGPEVLVLAGERGLVKRDLWEREFPEERVERVRSISEDSASLVGAAGGAGVEHVGQLHGPATGSLQWNGFRFSGGGTYDHAKKCHPTSMLSTAAY